MLINTLDLQKEPLAFDYPIPEGGIDYTLDTRQIGPLPIAGKADLLTEHRGPQEMVEDIRVRAAWHGDFEVLCARCVDPVAVPLAGNFDLLFRPETADAEAGERAISEDETEIGYYGKSGLLLEDVVREQVLLTLPGRTLCKPECLGLCTHCGHNLNAGPCACAGTAANPPSGNLLDPRWSALGALTGSFKQ